MVKVSKGKPGVYFNPPHNDMSHFFPGEYWVNEWFYMSLDDYMEKLQFDQFDASPMLTPEQVDLITTKVRKGENIDYLESPWVYNLGHMLKQAGGTVWQFNAVSPDLNGYIRHAILLGERSLYRVSWFEATFAYPFLRFICRIKNKLYKRKAKKEYEDWEKFLETKNA